MIFNIGVPEYTNTYDNVSTKDVLKEGKSFPILILGRDSYIEGASIFSALDEKLVYNLHIGRYCSVGANVHFIIDLNHDYKRVCMGRISGVGYKRPESLKRKGQIVIMNDCWIGNDSTIISGVTIGNGAVVAANAVVSNDVPAYAIVAGNPAKIIGYRFSESQIEALNLIRWWNWDTDRVVANSDDLYGDIDAFISKYIDAAKSELSSIIPAQICPVKKSNLGEEKILLYIPDFEQQYPTYPKVIDAFARAYAETNYELLLYIEEDELLEDKLNVLNKIFAGYESVNCYINLYIGKLDDKRGLFGQVDGYITNRSIENVQYMDMAELFGLPIISSVDLPIFNEIKVKSMVKTQGEIRDKGINNTQKDMFSKLAKSVSNCNKGIEQLADRMVQLSVNQVAMNSSINNLRYEFLADESIPLYPIVESGDKAIDRILNEGMSMSRFGDGEFAVIAGVNRQKFQHADEQLSERLKEVLKSNKDNVLICIADTYGDLSKYNDECRYNIRAYMTEEVRKQHYELLDMNRTYYDTYLTRPYASYRDNNTDAPKKRFEKLKKIWDGRKLLIVEGEKTRMGVGNDLFDNADSIIRILGPAEHAFDRYDDILAEVLKQDKERLVLIAMGATATVLAYDLACVGFQALDIGHIDMEYEWMLAGKGKKTEVKHKYNNEVAGGDMVEDIDDPAYESQIIARIY
ncbi:MAG: SP_1767 family glycosyltransferase [Wujia sp.]